MDDDETFRSTEIRIIRYEAEMYSTPLQPKPLSIFWLEVHQADINSATTACFEFLSQTEDIDHLLISAKVLILAIWRSFFWVLKGNLKIATVAPFIFTLCIPSPKIRSLAPTVLAVGGGCYTFQVLLIL